MASSPTKYVFDFSQGSKDQKDLLGRQGREPRRDDQAGPAGAARLHHHHRGVPGVPARTGSEPGRAAGAGDDRRCGTSRTRIGRRLGDRHDPLLVSVRSGAKFSMPGMMETVLNIGLNDASVKGLAEAVGQRAVRLGLLPPADPDVRQDGARHRRRACSPTRWTRRKAAKGVTTDVDLDVDDLEALVDDVQGRSSREQSGPGVPAAPARAARPGDPRGLRLLEHRPRPAVPAPRADPARPGHRGQRLHDGVRQPRRDLAAPASRSPATRPPGRPGVYGDYLANAQGEDVVAGIRNTLSPGRPRGARPGVAHSS